MELIKNMFANDFMTNVWYGFANIIGMLITLLIIHLIVHFIMIYGSTLAEGFEYESHNDWTGEWGYLKLDGVRVSHSKFEIYFWICFLKGLFRLITFQIPIIIIAFAILYFVGSNFRFFS
ncbi:MAG: hypothetical protein ACRCX8_20475 [Sarcina sp.]